MAYEDTSDYSPIAAWYDDTRNMPEHLLSELYERIRDLTGLDSSWRVLDVGCGTGQLTMPLLASGFEVVGIDVSRQMLGRAEAKLQAGWRGSFVQGDARAMEFADSSFDAVGVSKLFQHVGNWQQVIAEIVRIVRPGGIAMLINEKGAFSHTVRRCFGEECDRRGFTNRSPGNRDRDVIAAQFAHHGATRVNLDMSGLRWTKTLTYRECIEHMRLRLHAQFWSIPDVEYGDILRHVQENLELQPDGLDTTDVLTPSLEADLYVTSESHTQ